MTEQPDIPEPVTTTQQQLVVHVIQKTDVGRVRSENQDYAILSTIEDEALDSEKGRLMVVADGMGGHRGGATASRLAGTTIKNEYFHSQHEDISTALKGALEKANSRIFNEAQANPELRGMGTTCSALVIKGDQAYFAHVGDSRIYLVRGDAISQITDDHSLVASMVREGLLTPKEAEVHPRRNVLQRSMGVADQVEVDVKSSMPVQPGDTYILCSDGLHGLVREDEMREVCRMPVDDAAQEFIKRALERGAPDNVTVILARIQESDDAGLAAEMQSRKVTETATTEKISTDKMPSVTDQDLLSEMVANRARSEESKSSSTFASASTPTIPMDAIQDPSLAGASGKTPTLEVDMNPSTVNLNDRESGLKGQTVKVAPIVAPKPVEVDADETAPMGLTAPETVVPEPGGGGVLKWILIALLLFGAAGAAAYYWTHWGSRSATSSETPVGR